MQAASKLEITFLEGLTGSYTTVVLNVLGDNDKADGYGAATRVILQLVYLFCTCVFACYCNNENLFHNNLVLVVLGRRKFCYCIGFYYPSHQSKTSGVKDIIEHNPSQSPNVGFLKSAVSPKWGNAFNIFLVAYDEIFYIA
jgi:hypothetical protein